MKKFALVVAVVLMGGAVMAQTDVQQQQMNKNANRRSRQAEAIQKAPEGQKAEVTQKAHQRNKNVRARQHDVNQQINEHQ